LHGHDCVKIFQIIFIIHAGRFADAAQSTPARSTAANVAAATAALGKQSAGMR
jgi:hypothetical protein